MSDLLLKMSDRRQEAAVVAPESDSAGSAAVFVWSVFGAMVSLSLVLIWKYHTFVPYWEDWYEFLPYVAGDQAFDFQWLWSQEYEHRLFLLRLIGTPLLKAANGDYWLLQLFFIGAESGLAFALIRAMHKMRGHLVYADAFIPLVLLHWYMGEYLGWGTTLNYLLPTLLAGIILALMQRNGAQLGGVSGLIAAAVLLLFPLSGAGGLVYLPALVVWLAYCSVISWRSGRPDARAGSVVVWAGIMGACVLVVLYFRNFDRDATISPRTESDYFVIAKAALAFVTASFGHSAEDSWPYSGPPLAILLAITGILVLVAVWRRRGPEQDRALGLALFGASLVALDGAVAWGRGRLGVEYIWSYWYLPVLILVCTYFAWETCAPRSWSRLVQMALLVATAGMAALNVHTGLNKLRSRYYALKRLESDLRAGAPPYLLLARYGRTIAGNNDDTTGEKFAMMRRANIGYFGLMAEDPAFQETNVELRPNEMHAITWDPATRRAAGKEGSYLTFTLPEPRYVAAIQLEFSEYSTKLMTNLQMVWRKLGQGDFPSEPQYFRAFIPVDSPMTIFVGDTIDAIRLYPDNQYPFTCQIKRIAVYAPEGGEWAGASHVSTK